MASAQCWQGRPCKQVWNWTNVSLCTSTILSVVNKVCLSRSCILSSRLFWAGRSERCSQLRVLVALYWLQYVLCAEGDPNKATKWCFIWCPTLKGEQKAWFDKENTDLSGIFNFGQALFHHVCRESESHGYLVSSVWGEDLVVNLWWDIPLKQWNKKPNTSAGTFD